MNQYAFNALRYFSEQCTLNNENVSFVEDFNGKEQFGIDDKLFCGKWMAYFEDCDDVTNGYRVNPDLKDGDRAADFITYSKELHCKVYLWELNPPEKCLKCKTYLNQ